MRREWFPIALLGPVLLGSACSNDEEQWLAEADAKLPQAGAFVDALLAAQANQDEAPACEGSVPTPTLLYSQEVLDNLAEDMDVSAHPAWKPDKGHPCYVKASRSDLQVVKSYRARTLEARVKAGKVRGSVLGAAECHAAIESFVLYRSGELHAPVLMDGDRFEPGWAEGQLRVHQPDGTLSCIISLRATSDLEVGSSGRDDRGKQQSLDADLAVNLQLAAQEALGDIQHSTK